MKLKLDRLYIISSYNEQEYLSDVIEVYGWVKVANEVPLNEILVNEKAEKFFLEEFISYSIKNLIECKRFKHKIMMILTQQLMIESLRVFIKHFPTIEKHPKMTSILRFVFDHEKQFYRLNYVNEYHYFVISISFRL